MSTAQRVSRGFHRLGLFLAAIPLLVGGGWSLTIALDAANSARRSHDEQVELVCAQTRLVTTPKTKGNYFDRFDEPAEKSSGAVPPPGYVLDQPSSAQSSKRLYSTEELFGTAQGQAESKKKPWEMDWGNSVKGAPPQTQSAPDYGAMIDAAGAQNGTKPPAAPVSKYSDVPPGYLADDDQIDLQKLGCSDLSRTVSNREIFDASAPADFSFSAVLLPPLGIGLAFTLGLTLAVYGLVRAVGWVIGGFAS
jgi:hypothetical protein